MLQDSLLTLPIRSLGLGSARLGGHGPYCLPGSPVSTSSLVLWGAWELPLFFPFGVTLWILLWKFWVLFSLSICKVSPRG